MPNSVNPLALIQMIKSGSNPQQLLSSILEGSVANNPIGSNLLTMVRENRTADIEQFARNYLASQGRDFDVEFKRFKETYGLR